MQPPKRHSLSFCLLMALLFLKYTQITHAYTQSAQTWAGKKKKRKTCAFPIFSHDFPLCHSLTLQTHTLSPSKFLVQSYGNARLNLHRNPTQPASPSFPGTQFFNTGREAGCIYECEPHPAAVHLELLPFQHGSEPTHLFTPEACASGPPPPRLPLFHPSTHETQSERAGSVRAIHVSLE